MKTQSYRVIITFIFLGLFWFSCNEAKPPYDFKDQPLQGKINNIEWEYLSGVARPSFTSEDTLIVGLYNMEFDNPCTYAVSEEGLRFSIPKEIGVHLLGGSVELSEAVIFYQSTIKEYGFGGAIEILNINYNEMVIEGRADVRVDNESFVNGNFLIKFCD